MRLVSRKPPELRRSGCRMSQRLVEDEVLEPFAAREVLAHADGHLRRRAQPLPRVGVVHRQRILEPHRLDRFHGVGDLNRVRRSYSQWQCTIMSWSQPIASRQFSYPCRMPISSFVVSMRFDGIARRVGRRIAVREPELVACEPARVRLHLRRPLGNGRLVEHVLAARHGRRRAPCRGTCPPRSVDGRHVEDLAGQIPQRHFDAADRAHQVVRRAIGARPAQARVPRAHLRVELVDLERDPCRRATA